MRSVMAEQPEQPPDEPQHREEGRPDPEELLRRYSVRDSDMEVPPTSPPRAARGQISPQTGGYPHERGRMRVYLACAAGAGTPSTTLHDGHRRENPVTDAVAV